MASLTLRLQLNLIFYDVKRILFYQKTLENRLFSFWKRKIQILMFCLGKNGFDVSIVSEIVNAVNDNDDHIVDLFFFFDDLSSRFEFFIYVFTLLYRAKMIYFAAHTETFF